MPYRHPDQHEHKLKGKLSVSERLPKRLFVSISSGCPITYGNLFTSKHISKFGTISAFREFIIVLVPALTRFAFLFGQLNGSKHIRKGNKLRCSKQIHQFQQVTVSESPDKLQYLKTALLEEPFGIYVLGTTSRFLLSADTCHRNCSNSSKFFGF